MARSTGAHTRLTFTAMLTRREAPGAKAAQRERDLLLALLIEFHGLVIQLRSAKPTTLEYRQLVRHEAHVRRRIRQMTTDEPDD
jgi:hypothetical protein